MSNQVGSNLKIQYENSKKVIDSMSEQAVRQIEQKQICFIDDSKTSAYVTKKLLKQRGYVVDHFADAESALEALMENEYDLVITDLMISADGGVNGDDLIRLIRFSGHPKKSLIPILVVTGASDTSIFDELIKAGANKVLPKPLDGHVLHETIQLLIPDQTANSEHLSLAESHTSELVDQKEKANASQENSFTEIETQFDSELMDLDLEPAFDDSDVVTESILPEFDNVQGARHAKSKSKKSKPLKTDKAPNKESNQKISSKIKHKSEIKSEPDIPVLTSVVSTEAGKQNDQHTKTEDDKLSVNFQANESIVNEIEQLVQDKPSFAEFNPQQKPTKKSKSRTNRQRQRNEPIEAIISNDLDAKPSHSSFVNADVHVNKKQEAKSEPDPAEEIPPSMFDSIQKELTDIDKQAHQHRVDPIKQASSEPKVQQKTKKPQNTQVKKPVKPINVEPVAQKKAANKKSRQAAEEDNPLLDLLSHMEDPGFGTDFNAAPAQKTKQATFKPNAAASKSVWIILILAMVIPAGIFWYLGQLAVDVKVVLVKQGPIHSEISVPGRVVSKRNIKVNARAAGQLMEVRIKEGDRVKKGQTLARMDDKEAKSNVKRAQARLISIQEEVAALSKTQERLQRALDLGAVSRQIVEDAEAAWKTASAKQSVIEEELIAAELKLDRLQIKAPFSGLITAVSIQEGQWLTLSEHILTIVDMDQRVVEIRVDVSDSARLNIGQEVILSSEAFDNKTWKEKILKIGEEARTEDSANVIKVQTSLGRKAPKLRVGQQVDAEIRVASRNDALLLPHNVLFTHDGSTHAAVVENSKIVFIPVVTGIESVNQIEIIRGLRAEQEVVIPAGMPLEPGMNALVTNSKHNPTQ